MSTHSSVTRYRNDNILISRHAVLSVLAMYTLSNIHWHKQLNI